MNLRIFEFVINPEDESMGMKAISLVDKPAIESEYIAFNKADKKKVYFKVDDKKYIVAGLALIPDKLIYRVDDSTGEEYLGYFSAETIEMIMDKFMKEATKGTTKDVNFQHSDEEAKAHLIESFILRTPEMVEAVKKMGIEEAVEGAWFVSYKFDDSESYDKAVDGDFKGFSVEVVLQRELKLSKNNKIHNLNLVMTKINKFIDKFKTLLAEMETTLEDVAVPETGKSLRFGEVGQPVLWVSVDEAGEEVTEPAAEGEYILEDGRTLVVDTEGNLAEIKEAEEEPAPLPEEEMSEEQKAAKKAEEERLAEEARLAALKLAEEEEKKNVKSDLDKTLRELIPIDKNGDFSIMVSVMDGELKYGAMSSWTEIKLKAEADKQAEIDALKAENENLKAQLAKPVTKPAFVEYSEYHPKEDVTKLNNLERTLKRLKLDK